jgi:hypothetical protein
MQGELKAPITSMTVAFRYREFVYCFCICAVTAAVTFGLQWPTGNKIVKGILVKNN